MAKQDPKKRVSSRSSVQDLIHGAIRDITIPPLTPFQSNIINQPLTMQGEPGFTQNAPTIPNTTILPNSPLTESDFTGPTNIRPVNDLLQSRQPIIPTGDELRIPQLLFLNNAQPRPGVDIASPTQQLPTQTVSPTPEPLIQQGRATDPFGYSINSLIPPEGQVQDITGATPERVQTLLDALYPPQTFDPIFSMGNTGFFSRDTLQRRQIYQRGRNAVRDIIAQAFANVPSQVRQQQSLLGQANIYANRPNTAILKLQEAQLRIERGEDPAQVFKDIRGGFKAQEEPGSLGAQYLGAQHENLQLDNSQKKLVNPLQVAGQNLDNAIKQNNLDDAEKNREKLQKEIEKLTAQIQDIRDPSKKEKLLETVRLAQERAKLSVARLEEAKNVNIFNQLKAIVTGRDKGFDTKVLEEEFRKQHPNVNLPEDPGLLEQFLGFVRSLSGGSQGTTETPEETKKRLYEQYK